MEPVITAHPTQLAFTLACADVYRLEYDASGAVEIGPGRSQRIGVAYLVRPEWAATAASILRGLPVGTRLALRFSGGVHRAIIAAIDFEADCALLRLHRPLRDQIPMTLETGLSQPGVPWQTWAATPTLRSTGRPVQGLVQEPLSEDPRRGPVLLLRPLSGTRAWRPDLAGSPVLHGGRVLGHLRALRESPGSQEMLACPTPYVTALMPVSKSTPSLMPLPPPPKAAYSPALYVTSPAVEARARKALDEPGSPVIVWAPEQHGKTWLWEHVQRQLLEGPEAAGRYVVRASLDEYADMPEAAPVLSAMAQDFAVQLGARLGTDLTQAAQAAWARRARAEAGFDSVLEWVLLPRVTRRLIVVLDRVDALHGAAFRDVLLARLRGVLERAEQPLWQRLRLVLLTSTPPAALVKHPSLTPFTLGETIAVPELDAGQIAALTAQYGLLWSSDEIAALRALIGGNPYLVRLALYAAAVRGLRVEQITASGQKRARVFDAYLESFKQRLVTQPGLWTTALRVLREQALGAIDRLMLPRLVRMGLALPTDEGQSHAPVRSALYLRLLDL